MHIGKITLIIKYIIVIIMAIFTKKNLISYMTLNQGYIIYLNDKVVPDIIRSRYHTNFLIMYLLEYASDLLMDNAMYLLDMLEYALDILTGNTMYLLSRLEYLLSSVEYSICLNNRSSRKKRRSKKIKSPWRSMPVKKLSGKYFLVVSPPLRTPSSAVARSTPSRKGCSPSTHDAGTPRRVMPGSKSRRRSLTATHDMPSVETDLTSLCKGISSPTNNRRCTVIDSVSKHDKTSPQRRSSSPKRNKVNSRSKNRKTETLITIIAVRSLKNLVHRTSPRYLHTKVRKLVIANGKPMPNRVIQLRQGFE